MRKTVEWSELDMDIVREGLLYFILACKTGQEAIPGESQRAEELYDDMLNWDDKNNTEYDADDLGLD